MAKKKTRLEELQDYAKGAGLTVRTWSPGDGTTRYRFFDKPGPGQSYFGPASGIYTALGIKDAWNYLYGGSYYKPGRSSSHSTRRARGTRDVRVGDEVYAISGGRRHGPGIVEEIYPDGTMRVDFTRQLAGRLRVRPEDLVFVPKSSHARKKKIDHHEAKRLLKSDGVDFGQDFHELPSYEIQRILEVAKLTGYRKRADAPGSTARMYFQYLSRLR